MNLKLIVSKYELTEAWEATNRTDALKWDKILPRAIRGAIDESCYDTPEISEANDHTETHSSLQTPT